MRGDAEMLGHRHRRAVDERRREVRQLRLAEHQAQVAALRDLDGVGDRAGQVGEQRFHLRLRLEVLLAAEAPDALRVRQHLAFGDADARVMRLVIVGGEELHGVRRDHRQPSRAASCDRGAHVGLVAGQAVALQLDVEAAGKTRARRARGARPRRVAARSAWPSAPLSAPDRAIRPPSSSASQSHLTQRGRAGRSASSRAHNRSHRLR